MNLQFFDKGRRDFKRILKSKVYYELKGKRTPLFDVLRHRIFSKKRGKTLFYNKVSNFL